MSEATTEPKSNLNRLAGKYLTFFLGSEEYGVDVLHVQEIISMVKVTHVPKTPAFVKGVINLRGLVIPVVDLRLKFGMESMDYSTKTCIMVVEVENDHPDAKPTSMGLVIDKISEVITLEGQDIDPPPEFGVSINMEFITGVAKKGENIKILLDIHSVLSSSEMKALKQIQQPTNH